MEDGNGIDPKAFFEEQRRLYGEEKRQEQPYEDFCKACGIVLRTEAGQRMMLGLKRICQFGSQKFRAEDGYNTHAAACRDGATAVITEILVASQIDEKRSKNL